tara:strand:- start:8088 stop:10511 length:2424 start_codon:yes stop_codon:yes gene_type:complete
MPLSQPTTTPDAEDLVHAEAAPHFSSDGRVEGASQLPDYNAYSPEMCGTWEEGLQVIEDFDWPVPEEEPSEVEVASELPRVESAEDHEACHSQTDRRGTEPSNEIIAETATTDVATPPWIPSPYQAPAGDAAMLSIPIPATYSDALLEPECAQSLVTEDAEEVEHEEEIAAQIEREAAREPDVSMVEVEPENDQPIELAPPILGSASPDAQGDISHPFSDQSTLPGKLEEPPMQQSEPRPSETQDTPGAQIEAKQWETQLQEAAAKGPTNDTAELLSPGIIEADKNGAEQPTEVESSESIHDHNINISARETNSRNRSKPFKKQESSDTETEAPVTKKPKNDSLSRAQNTTPADAAVPSKNPNPPNPPSAPNRPTSRKSIKESPAPPTSHPSPLLFAQALQPSHAPPTPGRGNEEPTQSRPATSDPDPDMQEHLTDAPSSPATPSPSVDAPRYPRNNVSNRELQALTLDLTPGMHLGLHRPCETRPVRAGRSVDTPVRSTDGENVNADGILVGEEGVEEGNGAAGMAEKKQRNTAATRKMPAKRRSGSGSGVSKAARAPRAALGIKGEQRRRVDTTEQEASVGQEAMQDVFPAPKIESDKALTPTRAVANPTPAPKNVAPKPRSRKGRRTAAATAAEDEDEDEDEDDTDELALSPAPRQRTHASAAAYSEHSTTTPTGKKTSTRSTQLKITAAATPGTPALPAVSSPARNKFGFSPRATRSKTLAGTPASASAAKGAAKRKSGGKGTVGADERNVVERRVTRRASTIALEATPGAGVAVKGKGKGKGKGEMVAAESEPRKTRSAGRG